MNALIAAIVAFFVAIGGFLYYEDRSPDAPENSQDQSPVETPLQIPSLTSVDRSGQNLTSMPKDILGMTNLQQIDLSNNALTGALPAEIRHLTKLQILNISNNMMTGLPAELGQLSELRELHAANNQLTGIPHELGNLQKLEILDLSGNDISEQDLEVIRAKLPASTQIKL